MMTLESTMVLEVANGVGIGLRFKTTSGQPFSDVVTVSDGQHSLSVAHMLREVAKRIEEAHMREVLKAKR
jgi:hypothetical protein